MISPQFTNNSIENISILGLGWLGMPLAIHLNKLGFHIKGSNRTTQQTDFQHYAIDLSSDVAVPEDFLKTDLLIICIPPNVRKRPIDEHLRQLEKVLISGQYKYVFHISSTAVYPETSEVLSESDFDPQHDLYKAEQLIARFCQKNGIILQTLRCGGLMGYDRFPCKYYSKEPRYELSDQPVNYVHREDVINIIMELIKRDLVQGDTFNLVAPLHPPRSAVLNTCFNQSKFRAPEISYHKSAFKVISSQKLIDTLPYQFLYPDPLLFKYSM